MTLAIRANPTETPHEIYARYYNNGPCHDRADNQPCLECRRGADARFANRGGPDVRSGQEGAARRAALAGNSLARGPARGTASGTGREPAAAALGIRGRSPGKMLRLRFRASCRPLVR